MKSGKRKRLKVILRVLFAVLIAAAVFVIVSAAVRSRDNLTLRGVVSNVTSLWSKDTIADELNYERCTAVRQLGSGIATVSENGVRTYGGDNSEAVLSAFTMNEPYLESGGDAAIACDIGGNALKVFRLNSVVCEIETDNPIISAHINRSGWFTVCTRESGYTSSVTVYNAKGEAVYKWYSGEGYILSARVSDKNRGMTALVLSRGGSELVWFKFTSEEEQRRFTLSDGVIIDFDFMSGGRLAAVTAEKLLIINDKAETAAEYGFSGRVLSCYDIDKKTVVLGLWDDKFGKSGAVAAVSSSGKETGLVSVNGSITDVSWAGKTCAVLLENGVKTFVSSSLDGGKSFDFLGGRGVIAQKDGSVLVTGEYTASHLK